MVESDKNYDVLCKSHKGRLFIVSFAKHCESNDNSFEEKIEMKPHLQSLDSEGEFIILIILIIRMLSTKICLEFWATQPRL